MKRSVLASCLSLVVVGCVADAPGYDDGDEPDPEEDVTQIDAAAGTIPGCNSVTTVLLYSEGTNELKLPGAFAANVDKCTQYYVNLPALSGDKTMPRADADKVHALGPNFHAMAEFSWSAWRQWIAASPGTRDWRIAGHVFRTRMADAGYDVAKGDVWAINEFPSSTRTGEADVWTHERNAVKGLAEGDGTKHVNGVVFLAGMGQSLQNFSVYKANLKSWLQQSTWWSDMADNVRWFSYEMYADPHYNCVIGSNVGADRTNLNAYLEHVPRLAKAGGAATGTAFAYLKTHFVPLMSSAWNSETGFGDNRIPLDQFAKYQRLQIYATHYWASQFGYPGRRLGFAWAPKSSTVEQQDQLASVIASSVKRSYPANGFYNLGKFACSTSGSLNGCGCQAAGSYNRGWDTFASW